MALRSTLPGIAQAGGARTWSLPLGIRNPDSQIGTSNSDRNSKMRKPVFNNILSSLGVGGATVDTVLKSTDIVVGSTLHGEIHIKGGTSEQDIRGVVLELRTRCLIEAHGHDKAHGEIVIASGKVDPGKIGAGEERVIPISIDVPASAPISVGSTSTVLRTRLDVAGAIDPRDSDKVRLLPGRAMAAVLEGMGNAGFRLVETEVEYKPRRDNPFMQEFDFRPQSMGDFGIEEAELSFVPISGGMQVLLTVDNRGGLFGMGHERSARFRVMDASADAKALAGELRGAIESLR